MALSSRWRRVAAIWILGLFVAVTPIGAHGEPDQGEGDEAPPQKPVQEPEKGATAATIRPLVESRHGKVTVLLGGRVHRMILGYDDTADSGALFTDSEQGPTMFKVEVKATPSEALALGATIELGVQQNRPFRVNQEQPDNPGLDLTGRIAEITFAGPGFGKLSLGRGFASSWLAPEIDLSGTQFASLLPVGMLAPGLRFVERATGDLSGVAVGAYFIDVERLLVQDRLRYDSPRFAGLQLSGTLAADGRWDTALRLRHKPGKLSFVGGASFAEKPFMGIDRRYDGGISALHEPSGFNLTVGASKERFESGTDGNTWIVKLGWLADLVSLGKTAFSADYYVAQDAGGVVGNKGTSYGVFAVQKWPAYGLDFYIGLRRYEAEGSVPELEPLIVMPVGVVWNF